MKNFIPEICVGLLMSFLVVVVLQSSVNGKDNRMQMCKDFKVVEIKSVGYKHAKLKLHNEQIVEVKITKNQTISPGDTHKLCSY